jgi:hypothetical protein
MNDSGRRSDLFRRMRRQRSSPMHSGIAVVALPRLGEKSLSRAMGPSRNGHASVVGDCGPITDAGSGRVSMSNPG